MATTTASLCRVGAARMILESRAVVDELARCEMLGADLVGEFGLQIAGVKQNLKDVGLHKEGIRTAARKTAE